jgi:glucose-6-phosphate 1-dehydrogenase
MFAHVLNDHFMGKEHVMAAMAFRTGSLMFPKINHRKIPGLVN